VDPDTTTIAWVAFLMTSSLVLLAFLLLGGRKSRAEERVEGLLSDAPPAPDTVAQLARSALPKLGAPLVPKDEEERTRLQARLIHAGLYGRQALVIFLGVKMLLIVGPALAGLVAGLAGLVSVPSGLVVGACGGILGVIGPSFWLDRKKKRRQMAFRRSLPDTLDVLVICLEGGLSLAAALRRVAGELRGAHPLLASELNIVQREVQLGRSEGEALREFAGRADLEEIRSLAAVITQAERFGAGLVKSLRVHAEALRTKRLQYAEEMAQKAATKMLFPTVFFILPALFIIILGPAVIQVLAAFDNMHVGVP
jgi:tight adherence protein C